jgi:hypothetical protein
MMRRKNSKGKGQHDSKASKKKMKVSEDVAVVAEEVYEGPRDGNRVIGEDDEEVLCRSDDACGEKARDLGSWLQNDCPQDLIPRVLAYAGPQTAAAL